MGTAATYYTLVRVRRDLGGPENAASVRRRRCGITTYTILTFLVVLPIAAWVSDRLGRKLVMGIGMTGCILLAYPLASAMHGTAPSASPRRR